MLKKNRQDFLVISFLLLATVLTLILFSRIQSLQKRAEEKPAVGFDALPGNPLKRVWPYFAQGGEENQPMLSPAGREIKKLQPQLIRIDHLFDFPLLDQRVEEILSLGAIPFLSLSYFPNAISSNPTDIPPSYSDWQTLVEKTIQRYSGKNQKNIPGIYYEVWNEPDLFGKMTPQQYFSLYKASLSGAQKCQNCQDFKIGGPAITTLKKNWLDDFLKQINQAQLRIDFVSFHSYQVNPQRTLQEVEILKSLESYQKVLPKPEIIVSEWGSTSENSPLHDSYFDAAHVIHSVFLFKNSLDKVFAFELKDGPSPEEKKYWGRWGLLTHQNFGLTPKPRFYSFIYLNKLLEWGLNPILTAEEIPAIGSTDGKENYTIVGSRISTSSAPKTFNLRVSNLLPGLYTTNTFFLSPIHNPLTPTTDQIFFNGGDFSLNFTLLPYSTFLTEISRTSPALIKAPGKTNKANDFSARLTSFVPPLIFNIGPGEINHGEIEFWFKPNWGEAESLSHTLAETKDNGNGFSLWIEATGFNNLLRLGLLKDRKVTNELTLPLSWKESTWHQFVLRFNNQKMIFTLILDDQEFLLSFPPREPVKIGQYLYLGADVLQKTSAEGWIDDLKITLNNQVLYQKNFNQEVVVESE